MRRSAIRQDRSSPSCGGLSRSQLVEIVDDQNDGLVVLGDLGHDSVHQLIASSAAGNAGCVSVRFEPPNYGSRQDPRQNRCALLSRRRKQMRRDEVCSTGQSTPVTARSFRFPAAPRRS